MEEITHIVMHTLEHSIEDTLYLIPFLFVTYLAMEWLEHKTGGRTQEAVQRAGAAGPVLGSLLGVIPQCGFSAAAATLYAGRWLEHKTGGRTQEAVQRAGAAGPVLGSLLGVIPQCGFSAAAATLYAGRVITLGTVFAVFLSTSDEMLPIFLAEQVPIGTVVKVMGAKVIIGMVMGVITLGTVFAVFLSTSDEMLPIFLAEQVPIGTVVKVMGAKVIIGMVMGFIVDAALRLIRRDRQNLRIHELCARDKCHCGGDCATNLRIHELCARDKCHCGGDCATCEENPALVYEHHDDCGSCCTHEHHEHDHGHDHDHGWKGIAKSALVHTCEENPALVYEHHDDCGSCCTHEHHEHDHGHDHDHGWKGIAKSALVHTAQVTLFIFVITLVLNGVLETVGEDALAAFVGSNSVLAVFASALVGLVPNCAASVVIAQLYVEGVLGAGAMLSGLLVSAGIGLLVLVRTNRHAKENLAIVAILYVTGVAWGLAVNALGIVF